MNKTTPPPLSVLAIISFTLFLSGACSSDPGRYSQSNLKTTPQGQVSLLKAKTGERYIGRITAVDKNGIVLESEFGSLTIPYEQITEITHSPESQIIDGEYYYPNPNDSRLLFAPTGRMLKQGEGTYGNHYVLFNQLSYGVTDFLTVTAGSTLVPGIGLDQQFINAGLKVGTSFDDYLSGAVGYNYLGVPGEFGGHLGYGVLTLGGGGHRESFTIGGGMVGDEDSAGFLLVGAEYRVSRGAALVSENYLFAADDTVEPLLSGGIRFFGESFTVDLAMLYLREVEDWPLIPYVDFVYQF